MLRKDKEMKDLAELHAVIDQAQVCRLAFMVGDEPRIVPMSFGFEAGTIYLHSADGGEKAAALTAGLPVALEFEDHPELLTTGAPCGWSFRCRSVVARGRPELVTVHEERIHALNVIIRHYEAGAPYRYFRPEDLEKLLVFSLVPLVLTGKRSPADG